MRGKWSLYTTLHVIQQTITSILEGWIAENDRCGIWLSFMITFSITHSIEMKSKYSFWCRKEYNLRLIWLTTTSFKPRRTTFYAALGSRKLALKSWNPIKILKGLRKVNRRLKKKNISGNLKGEGLIQGGIILFDKNGKARYAYREETGSEVPIQDVIAAVKMIKSDA